MRGGKSWLFPWKKPLLTGLEPQEWDAMPLAAKVESHPDGEITFESTGLCGEDAIGMGGPENLVLTPRYLH